MTQRKAIARQYQYQSNVSGCLFKQYGGSKHTRVILGRAEFGELGQFRRVAHSAGEQLLPASRPLLQHGADPMTAGIDGGLPLHTFVGNIQTSSYDILHDVEIALILLKNPVVANSSNANMARLLLESCAKARSPGGSS